jgi:hypothetical protein
MGIGSEVFCAVKQGRKGIGVELKKSYFNQAVKNLADVHKVEQAQVVQMTLFQNRTAHARKHLLDGAGCRTVFPAATVRRGAAPAGRGQDNTQT